MWYLDSINLSDKSLVIRSEYSYSKSPENFSLHCILCKPECQLQFTFCEICRKFAWLKNQSEISSSILDKESFRSDRTDLWKSIYAVNDFDGYTLKGLATVQTLKYLSSCCTHWRFSRLKYSGLRSSSALGLWLEWTPDHTVRCLCRPPGNLGLP